MQRRTFLASAASAAAVVIASRSPATSPPRAQRIRVLTYNIHHGMGMDRKLDLDRIAAVIRRADPDLVSLQEVDNKTVRSGKVDQAAALGERTGLRPAFGAAMAYGGGGYGNAILSRFPIKSVDVHPLPSSPTEEPRCLVLASIEVAAREGAPAGLVDFGAVHLNHRNPAERRRQVDLLLKRMPAEGEQARPAIVAGDFNAEAASDEIKLLASGYLDAGARRLPPDEGASRPAGTAKAIAMATFPAGEPASRIDYVFAAPSAGWKIVRAEVLAEAVASDHRPLLVELERV